MTIILYRPKIQLPDERVTLGSLRAKITFHIPAWLGVWLAKRQRCR